VRVDQHAFLYLTHRTVIISRVRYISCIAYGSPIQSANSRHHNMATPRERIHDTPKTKVCSGRHALVLQAFQVYELYEKVESMGIQSG